MLLTTHRRDPTTTQRGSFCLLRFRPEPLHFSLNQPGHPRFSQGDHIDAELSADVRST
uniref:Uncharacterized protein n=1 Tax=Tetranychus urticae TaxID=32264 RepID=T1JQF9_TETUR